ncbi:MAG: peptidylprolyl isomerase [Fimbriimonadaceae bacterium]|nr:peptidylprolyl isomerase [Chitinophagales bacterium]
MKAKVTIIILCIFLVATSFTTDKGSKKKLPKGLYAEIQTSKGNILCFLEFQKAPITVANFVGLAEGKIHNAAKPDGTLYYDGLKFHRVVKDFVIQGGDPDGTGAGGPGYKFKNEIHSDLKHSKAGTLAMANAGANTNGSQFYITHKATSQLDGNYNVFGQVVEGQDVVDAIVQGDVMEHIKIIRVGKEAKKFDAAKVFAEAEKNGDVVRQ